MKKILVGIDFSDSTPVVLKYATEFARNTGAELVLYHAVGVPPELPNFAYRLKPADLEDYLLKEAESNLDKLARDIPDDVTGAIRCDTRKGWQGIVSAANEEDADLILIGSHGYSRIERMIGTTAHRVVGHADRPVLVVRSAQMTK